MPNGLLELLGRPIAFQRCFVKITGSITASLMLSQAVYWSDKGSLADGWFYKTQDEWEAETGMSRYEQETARKILRSKGLLEEKKIGVPCKLHYRVNLDSLQTSLRENHILECGNPADKNDGKPHSCNTEITAETTTEKKDGDSPFLFPKEPTLEPKQRAIQGIQNLIFPYFLDQTERKPSLYTLTPSRLQKGVDRFLECVSKTNGDWQLAGKMFYQAIEALAESDWHMGRDKRTNGKKYNDWIDNLCKNAEQFEKWLEVAV